MRKLNLIIDVAKCEDCNNCFLACKDEFVDNDFPGYAGMQPKHGHRWMNILRKERGQFPMIDAVFLPMPCMHCDEAACLKAAKGGAVYKRNDGAVIIDPVKGKGQKDLVIACPYGAIYWNEEKEIPQKCNLCIHLLDYYWKEPRCVQACPTGALRLVEGDEAAFQRIVLEQDLKVYHPEFKTKPRVYYKNLYRFTRAFIGGSVAMTMNGLEECAEGAKVILFKADNQKIGETVTDNYGDFTFDNLEEESGQYRLEIGLGGFEKKTIEVNLTNSQSLGIIHL